MMLWKVESLDDRVLDRSQSGWPRGSNSSWAPSNAIDG